MSTTTEEVRAACGILAEHAALIAQHGNTVATLQGLAGRYQRAAATALAPAPAPREPEPATLDAESIYAARHAAVMAAQAARRATP